MAEKHKERRAGSESAINTNTNTMNIQYIENPTFAGGTEIKVCHTESLDQRAQLAVQLMSHLAIVSCIPDGEDSSGRQKVRMMTPGEVVDRATEIADRAWAEFKMQGWILGIPLPKPPVIKLCSE